MIARIYSAGNGERKLIGREWKVSPKFAVTFACHEKNTAMVVTDDALPGGMLAIPEGYVLAFGEEAANG